MPSTAQRDHLAAARERLATMTTELAASERWQAMLRMQQSFHSYSLNNTYLIYCQCPHATYLRGFKGWLELGRCVRKGEHSIRIMAPRPYTTTDADGTEETRLSFAMVSVFDYSQTDPLPGVDHPFTIPPRLTVAGDEGVARAAYDALATVLTSDGVTITTEPARRGQRGSYRWASRSINVCPDTVPDMLAVLVHEAAHHASAGVGADYAEGEVIAQSVSYLVLDALGFDASAVSADYLAGWLEEQPQRLTVAVPHILTTAATFLDDITARHAA